MANATVSYTFTNGTVADGPQVNTNFSDILTWLNNRNAGSDTWGYVKVSSSDANPVDFSSSAATTEVSINNTATDGDPILTFKLSGSQLYTIGVDDSSSDILNIGTTSLTTNVAMAIPSTGSQVRFASGSLGTPSISFISDIDTGAWLSGTNEISVSVGGLLGLKINSNQQTLHAAGLVSVPSIGFTGDIDTGFWSSGANEISAAVGGSVGLTLNANKQLLHGDGTLALPSISIISDPDTGFYLSAENEISTSVGGLLAMKVNSNQQTLHATGTVTVPSVSFTSSTGSGMYLISGNRIGFASNGNLCLDMDSGTSIFATLSIHPSAAAGANLGSATNYWNDVSYKTLTDRGCLPWCDEGVELADGSVVSDTEALLKIKKHENKQTIQGLPMLDYKTFPKKAYKKADDNGVLLPRDENDEPVEGSDGIEMTMMFGVMIGAIKELTLRVKDLEKKNGNKNL